MSLSYKLVFLAFVIVCIASDEACSFSSFVDFKLLYRVIGQCRLSLQESCDEDTLTSHIRNCKVHYVNYAMT